jgi:hypothetical protein
MGRQYCWDSSTESIAVEEQVIGVHHWCGVEVLGRNATIERDCAVIQVVVDVAQLAS